MQIIVENNEIIINDSDLDIYAALELKGRLDAFLKEGLKKAVLDLSRVSSLSTPAVQVILSAADEFESLDIKKCPLNQTLIEDLRSIGIKL